MLFANEYWPPFLVLGNYNDECLLNELSGNDVNRRHWTSYCLQKKIRSKSMPVGLATFSSPQKIVTKNVFEAFYDVVSTVWKFGFLL